MSNWASKCATSRASAAQKIAMAAQVVGQPPPQPAPSVTKGREAQCIGQSVTTALHALCTPLLPLTPPCRSSRHCRVTFQQVSAQLETPVEIREESEKTILQSPSNDGVASNFCPELPDASCKTLHRDEESDHLSNTPTKINGNSVQPDGKPGRVLSQMEELREDAPPGQSNDQDHLTNLKEEADFNEETSKLVVPSLSEWLKPPASNEERWRKKSCDKSPAADRPIIGLVATHWNENEPIRVSPKWFDGNGIPNSTNKYKEDQKVSWHATPFEERLEKALSDEQLYPRRQLSGRPDDEREEMDTAASNV